MFFNKIGHFILFGSIYIAICAIALCLQTSMTLDIPFNKLSFYCFVFGATLAQYNLHYLVKKKAVKNSKRLAWSMKHKVTHKVLFATGILLILFSFFGFRLKHFFILGVLGVISLLYSFPVLPFGKKRIKDYGYLKIITLSLLWTVVTVWFPAVNHPFDLKLFAFVFMKRFVFMFVLCLIFDVRDIEIDYEERIHTVAVILGKKRSYWLSYMALLLFLLLAVFQNLYYPDMKELWAMVVSSVCTFLIIEVSKKNHSDIVYLAGIDGMMLLQPLLIYVFGIMF